MAHNILVNRLVSNLVQCFFQKAEETTTKILIDFVHSEQVWWEIVTFEAKSRIV